jgi:hypothetical protein
MPLFALGLLTIESGAALLGFTSAPLAFAAIVLAPGLALAPSLPHQLRQPVIRFAVVPPLSIAASAVALITAATLGAPFTATTVRLTLAAIVVVGLCASLVAERRPAEFNQVGGRFLASELTGLSLVVAILTFAFALQSLILGRKPLLGIDWGHYLFYAERMTAEHSLALDNPFWMMGMPFREDPGAPILYASHMLLADQPAAQLVQVGIWLFALCSILSVFVFVATLWGKTAGFLAAAIYGAVPMNLNILAWYGLANVLGFVLLPLVLLVAGIVLRGRADLRWAWFFTLMLFALAAAHRLTLIVALVVLLPLLLIPLVRERRGTARFLCQVAAFALAGIPVLYDLLQRNVGDGGVQGYEAYLATKISWDFVAMDLTWVISALGVGSLVILLVARAKADAADLVLYALAGAILALAYAWLFHIPTSYLRAAYFLPLLLAAAIAVAWTRFLPKIALALAIPLLAFVAFQASERTDALIRFYDYANEGSLGGLEYLSQRQTTVGMDRRSSVIVTDACWGFLAVWLLQQPVLAALDRSQILPKAEVEPAERARRILYGGANGAELARDVGARYALVDPQCSHDTGRAFDVPDIGVPIYASTRLVILDLRRGTPESEYG